MAWHEQPQDDTAAVTDSHIQVFDIYSIFLILTKHSLHLYLIELITNLNWRAIILIQLKAKELKFVQQHGKKNLS